MPVVLPIAIDLSVVLVFALLFALAYIAATSLEWLGNSLASVLSVLPFGLGKKAGTGVKNLALPAAHYFGGLAAKADHRMAKAWHATAHLAEQTGHALKVAALATWQLGDYVHDVVRPAFLHATVGRLTNHAKVQDVRAERTARTARTDHAALTHPHSGPIGSAIHDETRPLRAKADHTAQTVSNYAHALPLPQAQALPGEVADLRARARTVERSLGRLWERVRGVDKRLAGLGAVALVGAAVAKLGGGFIFCRNWKTLGRRVCRMNPSTLEDLLGLTLVVVGTISIIEFAKELQGVVGEVADDVHRLIREG